MRKTPSCNEETMEIYFDKALYKDIFTQKFEKVQKFDSSVGKKNN